MPVFSKISNKCNIHSRYITGHSPIGHAGYPLSHYYLFYRPLHPPRTINRAQDERSPLGIASGTDPDGQIGADILAGFAFDTILRIGLLNDIGAFCIPARGYCQYLLRTGRDTDTAALADPVFYTNIHITHQVLAEFLRFHGKSSPYGHRPASGY